MRGWLFGAAKRVARGARRRFWYADAPKTAKPWVYEALEHFRTLPEPVRGRHSFWGWMLGPDGTPPWKIDPADIEWTKHPVKGRQCSNCQRFYTHVASGTGLCDAVQGVWGPTWWCDRWEAPMPVDEYQAYQRGEVLHNDPD